jgi:uncharacterized protein
VVHQYKSNGYNIVIDSNSGSIHWVDDVTYDVISRYEKGDYEGLDPSAIAEVLPEIRELEKQGKLFSPDPFRDMAAEFKERHSVLKAMCLHVAHDCNMDCGYCFAGKGEYHGKRSLMSLETGKRAIDFLVENSHGRRNLEVDFFGGEPLLNWQMVKDLVAYGRTFKDKNFRFTLTTNGLLLDDEVIDFTSREMSNVVISLDGRKKVNDAMRRTKSGGGTYDLVIRQFKRLAENRGGKDYYMRGTFTAGNTDFAEDILHMADLGFDQLSMEPVVGNEDAPFTLKEKHLPRIFRQYEYLAEEMIRRRRKGKGFTFYHFMIDLQGGPCISKRVSGCGVGKEYIAVTPEGEIYPCHQFVGEEAFRLGDLDRGIFRKDVLAEFDRCTVYGRRECSDCFAKLYCSGGCAANGYHATGDVTGLYDMGCELHKKRVECAIMMKIDESIAKGETHG